MRWIPTYLSLLALSILLSGCVTTTTHTNKADRATADFARGVNTLLHQEHGDDAAHQRQLQLISDAEHKLVEMANADPGIRFPSGSGGVAMALVSLVTGTGGIAGVGMAVKMMIERNQTRQLARDLTGMDAKASQEHAIKHKGLI